MQEQITMLLLNLGIKPRSRQGLYLSTALRLICEEPERLQLITKWLYPDVARQCSATPCAVERGLRAALRNAWHRAAHGTMLGMFSLDRAARPSAGLMLSFLYEYLSAQQQA